MNRTTFALIALAVLGLQATAVQAQTSAQPPARLPAATIVGENAKTITVQNDRQGAVTIYVDVGRVDRAIGTVAAGSTATVSLPDALVRGQRTVKLIARTDVDAKAVASYAVAMNDALPVGLLIPPADGLPASDSIMVSLPKGATNTATVTIANERAGAVSVYAEQGLLFVKLGEVGAKQQETLLLPSSLIKSKAPVRVFARPDGASSISTKAMKLEQGDHIAVIVM